MIWRNSWHSRLAQITDFITSLIGNLLSYYIWFIIFELKPKIVPKPFEITSFHILQLILLSLSYVFLFNFFKEYSFQRFTSLLKEYTVILKVCSFSFLFTGFIVFILGEKNFPRTIIILSALIVFMLFMIQKTIMFYLASWLRNKGYNRKRVLIIGTGLRAVNFIETVHQKFKWGLDIIGLLTSDNEKIGSEILGYKILDTYKNLESIIKNYNPEEVIITLSTREFDTIREILETCEKVGITVRLNSDFFGHIVQDVVIDNLYNINIISFNYKRRTEIDLIVKRLFDIIISFLGIIILSPVFIAIAMLIAYEDGSPILYQWRIMGLNRRPIRSWKFRTMVKNADSMKKELISKNEMTGPMFKMTNDPRILKIGHFLRKYSLDELPQLFSVLKGDLSIVGPRPPLQTEFKEFDLWHRRKLSVKPGITCLWQISGRNNINDFNEWAQLDLQYIDNWSIWLDFKIFFKTIPAVLTGRGAK